MNVKVIENDLIVNDVVINKQSDISSLSEGQKRKIDLEKKITLIILDDEGIRYWVKDNQISEIQVCLNDVGKSDYFPKSAASEIVMINNIPFNRETKINNEIIEKLKLLIDDDNLRFGITTYVFKSDSIRYSFTLNSEGLIKHISISFP